MSRVSWSAFTQKYGPIIRPGHVKPHYTQGRDLSVLLTLARWKQPKKIAELYTAYGDTALALARSNPQAHVYAFDVCQEMEAMGPKNQEVLPKAEVGSAFTDLPFRNLSLCIQPGAEMVEYILERGPFDVIFIDGNHILECVLRDTALALASVMPGGILVWDDYWESSHDVMEMIDGLNELTKDRITLVEGTRVCFAEMSFDFKHELVQALGRFR